VEYVDLYLIHFPVSMKVTDQGQDCSTLVKENLVAMDMKGVWEEMEECHRKGLAKAIGVSNFTCKKLEHLLSFAETIPAVNQVLDSPQVFIYSSNSKKIVILLAKFEGFSTL
jgi:diketogulonate reductase-like aldo/keto reductase